MNPSDPSESGRSPAIIRRSAYSFADTVARLSAAIVDAGSTLFLTLDQQAAARDAGLALRLTTLLIFGNPKGGTPLMDAFPLYALELPLRLIVWQDADATQVAYVSAAATAQRYGVTGKDAALAAMDRLLGVVVDSIGSP